MIKKERFFYIFFVFFLSAFFAAAEPFVESHPIIADLDLEEEKKEEEEEKAEEENVTGLASFFRNLFMLEKTKKSSVRIAYFTDSMTEMDLIVSDIRRSYQEKYGGQGIGFVPLSNYQSSIHGPSITLRPSEQWTTHVSRRRSPAAFGVSGYVSFANAGFAGTFYRGGVFSLTRPTLFYGRSNNSSARAVVTTESGTETVALQPTEILNTRLLAQDAVTLNIRVNNARTVPFYGVNFSGEYGVNVDNFPTRSSSGIPLETLNIELMNAFQQELQYDLIVLQFGANVLNSTMRDYGWYAAGMTNVVEHIKKCFPGAGILVISSPDKASRFAGTLRTEPALIPLLQAQEEFARNTGAAFINLFELMGGEGSMARWSRQRPSLAQPDLIHFSVPGSRKIGELIFDRIEEEYEIFKIQNGLFVDDVLLIYDNLSIDADHD